LKYGKSDELEIHELQNKAGRAEHWQRRAERDIQGLGSSRTGNIRGKPNANQTCGMLR
jgi:hypothetical protein